MKIILTQDCTGVGIKGQIINVSDGFAQNYLIARGLAVKIDDSTAKQYRVIHVQKDKQVKAPKISKAQKRNMKKEIEKAKNK